MAFTLFTSELRLNLLLIEDLNEIEWRCYWLKLIEDVVDWNWLKMLLIEIEWRCCWLKLNEDVVDWNWTKMMLIEIERRWCWLKLIEDVDWNWTKMMLIEIEWRWCWLKLIEALELVEQVEGVLHEKQFEAEANLIYKFDWDKRNSYNQKVHGAVPVTGEPSGTTGNCFALNL